MKTLYWDEGCLNLLDQTLLPREIKYISCRDYLAVAEAIKRLCVRGAPAIGAAAAYGLVLGARQVDCGKSTEFRERVKAVGEELKATRPTAVNLAWAVDRLIRKMEENSIAATCAGEDRTGDRGVENLKQVLLQEAHAIYEEDLAMNRRMGDYGKELIPVKANILTHCNAGALATAGFGTALGVVRAAHAEGKEIHVFVDETRPLLQGARLTAWEMVQEGIPATLITDNMAAYLMQQGKIDLVIVGADRITANGDVANKIGTYGLAVLARHHGIPFYVAAPMSTVDLSLSSGHEIPIEERDPEEVTNFYNTRVAPEGVDVYNPAFDVTPNELVTAIITDKGIFRTPFGDRLRKAQG